MNNNNDVLIPPEYLKSQAEFLHTMAGNLIVTLDATVEQMIKKAKGRKDLAAALQYLGELTYIATFRVNHALAHLYKLKEQAAK